MTDGVAGLDKIDESLMTYDLADEVLEAAARVDGGPAITIGYCATASTSWYCLPNWAAQWLGKHEPGLRVVAPDGA
jgi:dienelactone hydrolase